MGVAKGNGTEPQDQTCGRGERQQNHKTRLVQSKHVAGLSWHSRPTLQIRRPAYSVQTRRPSELAPRTVDGDLVCDPALGRVYDDKVAAQCGVAPLLH